MACVWIATNYSEAGQIAMGYSYAEMYFCAVFQTMLIMIGSTPLQFHKGQGFFIDPTDFPWPLAVVMQGAGMTFFVLMISYTSAVMSNRTDSFHKFRASMKDADEDMKYHNGERSPTRFLSLWRPSDLPPITACVPTVRRQCRHCCSGKSASRSSTCGATSYFTPRTHFIRT